MSKLRKTTPTKYSLTAKVNFAVGGLALLMAAGAGLTAYNVYAHGAELEDLADTVALLNPYQKEQLKAAICEGGAGDALDSDPALKANYDRCVADFVKRTINNGAFQREEAANETHEGEKGLIASAAVATGGLGLLVSGFRRKKVPAAHAV